MSSSEFIWAKSLMSFATMGAETGVYLDQKHQTGSPEVVVGSSPGQAPRAVTRSREHIPIGV
jgi:periplasmic protein TorT